MKNIQETLTIGVQHHQAGRLSVAEQIYRQILETQPNHADALHLLGVTAYQDGNQEVALELIGKAIEVKPSVATFHNNLGNVLQNLGDLESAIASYQQALTLKPDYPEAHNNKGNVLLIQRKLDEAIACYKLALLLKPDYPEAHNNLGNALQSQGKLDEAIACYKLALLLKPDYPEAHKNLGNALLIQGKLDEAIACYKLALTLWQDYPEAENNLGIAFLGKEWYEQAQEIFHSIFMKKYGLENAARFDPTIPADGGDVTTELYASPFKLIDRIDQLNYLLAKGKIDSSFQTLVTRYQLLLQELEDQVDRVPYTPLTPRQAELFGGYYDKVIYYADAPRLAGSTMNDSLNYQAIEDSYLASSVVYFDDFLTPETLAALRKFCLESTVFFRHSEAGFVGSYMTEGFNCSLIYQFISDLKERLPRVLGGLPLNNMWVYRYGSRGSGVKTHTGDGSVTINFWITPEEANLDPEGGGGLVVYSKEQPLDWDWLKFNTYKDDPEIQAQINEFLGTAEELTIPYRCNRAVLFHSNLFHRSVPFHFRDGFDNRRMNVTMLFGQRGKESAPLK